MGEERAAIVTELLHSIALSPPSSLLLPLYPSLSLHFPAPTPLQFSPFFLLSLTFLSLLLSPSFLPLPHPSSSSLLLFLLSPSPQITSGEYIQMSGRAGRRGLDERGIVMLMVDERMDSTVGKGLLRVRLCSHMSLLQVLQTPHVHIVYVCMCVMYTACTTQHVHTYLHVYIFIVTHVHVHKTYTTTIAQIYNPPLPLPLPLHPTHTHIYTPRVVQTL